MISVARESFKYFRKYIAAFIAVIILGWITITSILLTPLIPSLLIDRIINPALGFEAKVDERNIFTQFLSGFAVDDYWGMFIQLSIIFFAIFIIKYICNYIRWNIGQIYGVKAEGDLRMAALKKLITQSSEILSRHTSGDLLSICNSDIIVLKDTYSVQLSVLLNIFIFWGFGSYFLFNINWMLLILPLLGGLVTLVITRFYMREMRQCYNQIRAGNINLNTCVHENINGVRVIRGFASEGVEQEKFDQKNEDVNKAFTRQSRTVARYNVFFGIISNAMLFGSMVIGIYLAVSGEITAGQFATFLAYVGLISTPFSTLANVLEQFQNAHIAGTRLFTFLNTNDAVEESKNAVRLTKKPSITLIGATVQNDDKVLLKNINLSLPYGKKLGIMGATGSGKSTLIRTIARFCDPARGDVLINGISAKDISTENLREQFSFVMQDVFLFSDTVRQNIAFFNPSMDFEAVMRAAKDAMAHEFIMALSDGYDTIVGERGVGLSGGQKQRVSIARALAKDSPVILFDDCTSALDLITEREILSNIKARYADKTFVISSHRVSAVCDCDEIIFMHNGEIVERGTHEQLMELGGMYCDVQRRQA